MEQAERVLLIGPMGVGKTTVAGLLAARLGWVPLDTDALVAQAAGCDIPAIFAAEGEEGFRRREQAALREVSKQVRVVVATGGGTLCSEVAWSLVGPGTLVVWLDAPAQELRRRIGDTAGRPLLDAAADPEFVLMELSERRRTWYSRAHVRVEAGDRSPDQVARTVARRMGRGAEEAR